MKAHDEMVDAILGDVGRTLRQVDADEVEALGAALLAAERVFVAGKGRTGLQMRAFAMRLMHLGLIVHVVDDVTTPAIGAGDLLLIGSSSGRTGSLLRYIETVGTTGARLATLTGNSGIADGRPPRTAASTSPPPISRRAAAPAWTLCWSWARCLNIAWVCSAICSSSG